MPAKSEKQRKFMGAELARKREGKKTETGMSEKQLEDFASKPTRQEEVDLAGAEQDPHAGADQGVGAEQDRLARAGG